MYAATDGTKQAGAAAATANDRLSVALVDKCVELDQYERDIHALSESPDLDALPGAELLLALEDATGLIAKAVATAEDHVRRAAEVREQLSAATATGRPKEATGARA
jgi:hypothetical protein